MARKNNAAVGYIVGTLCVIAAAVSAVMFKDSGGAPFTADRKSVKQADIDKSDTYVEFIDVGQGDCTLVCSQGKFMLIDTGERDSDDRVVNLLKEKGVERLEYMMLTHPHSDHMGEAADIARNFEIGSIIMPIVPEDLTPTSQVYEKLLDAVEEYDIPFEAASDSEYTLGECEIATYAPHEDYSGLNNYSMLIKLCHGENSFLITGDCEKEEEKEYLQRRIDISADVLKAAHHGSSTSSTSQWLAEVLPQYTVISCGADNKYGHPDDETYSRICKYSPKVYITAEDGSVIFYSDGNGLTVKTEKS